MSMLRNAWDIAPIKFVGLCQGSQVEAGGVGSDATENGLDIEEDAIEEIDLSQGSQTSKK